MRFGKLAPARWTSLVLRWQLVTLFVVSLTIRLFFAIPVIQSGVPPILDESGYLSRAESIYALLTQLLSGQGIGKAAVDGAYGGGKWPPLHPLLLTLAFLFGGAEVGVARLAVAVISALTTPLVYVLTTRLSARKAGILASLVHALYPGFVAFSHCLWSETLLIFLTALGIYLAVCLVDSTDSRRGALHAILLGVTLGLAALTRAAALPILFAVPCWVACSVKRSSSRLVFPVLIVAAWALVLAPWEAALVVREGRLVPISTVGDYNLFAGNNGWVPEGFGSVEGLPEEEIACAAAEQYAMAKGIGRDAAMRELAVQEIVRHPLRFVGRSLLRLRLFWSADSVMLRHFLRVAYPPASNGLVGSLWLLAFVSFILFVASAVLGLLSSKPALSRRGLLMLLAVAYMAVPVATLVMTRFTIVLLAILLPAAGHGLAHVRQTRPRTRGIVVLLTVALCSSSLAALPEALAPVYPSGYYAPLVRRIDSLLHTRTAVIDRVVLRTADPESADRLHIAVASGEYRFAETQGSEVVWSVSPEQKEIRLTLYSYDATSVPEMSISSGRTGLSVTLRPVRRSSWWRWQPTGLEHVEFTWKAGRKLVPPLDD